MKYILKKETKPTLTTFGKYKAVARHHQTVGVEDIIREVSQQCSLSEGAVISVMSGLSEVIGRRLRQGDKVRLPDLGLMKLEIESDKVDDPSLFRASQHIRGVRLHFLPESDRGTPALYQDIKFEREL
ncbi:MAG: hypothetical protein IJP74_13050 [Prevotella sp.]|nr:hypothetical protein [Prevotella sp.]MBR0050219.1 hypothetical protein [Prevotella sp.]